jgi:HAE1 family hydrophobic/amphiphilic exporter-1
LIDLVLRRPRGTALVFTALLGLAVVSFFRIPIEGTPDTTLPSLSVSTTWAGADPEAVCEQVSRPIEEAARQVRGVEEVSSTSGLSISTVTVSFAKGTDMDVAAMELTERISMIRRDLPATVRPSQITQSVPREMESEGFLVYSLTGAERPVLKQISEDIVVPALERVDGVSSVIVEGLGSEEIVINIDLEALRAYDITLAHVAYAIRAGIVDRNVGVVTDSSGIEAVLRVSSVPGAPGEIEAVPLAYRGGRFVTIGDISHGISVSYSDQTGAIFRYNGLDQVSLQVDRSPGSNAVATARRVAGAIERIERSLPRGVMLDLTEDGTEGIVKDLNSLSWRALLSIVLITLVLLALNPSPMTTPLVLSSILFSAALAVTAVFLAGYTINVLTLSALAIAFGLLVDGAVVVLEGIAYRRRQGFSPMEAAGKGAREVAVPILGGILTTLVALVPLLASQGVLKLYYKPFAFTVAATLMASYVVCLTLVPSIAGHRGKSDWYKERLWDRTLARWVSLLHHRPWIVLSATILLVAGSVFVLVTKVEHGETWNFGGWERNSVYASIRFPPGTPQEIVDGVARQFEVILARRDGIRASRTYVWGESTYIYTEFDDEALESGFALQVEAEAMAFATTVGGTSSVWVGGISPDGYWKNSTSAGMMQTIELRGYDYQGLKNIATNLAAMLSSHPRIQGVDINFSRREMNREQLAVVFDRQELADLGLNPVQLIQAFSYNFAGGYGGQVRVADASLDLSFRLEGRENPELSDVLDSGIQTRDGTIRLGDVVSIDTLSVQGSIKRENGEYVRTIAYSFMGAERMAARFRSTLLQSLSLPSGYRVYEETNWIPEWLRKEEGADMNLLVALAILAVFAVTAIVFESFTAPLWVLAVVPMALVGVVAGFWAFGRVFSPEAYVGSVFLVGIAVNNSILLVDSYVKKEKEGIPVRTAIDLVVQERLRPVLQTTATTVLGLLPLVLWPISGQDLWGTLSFTVVCGMVVSTPLVLVALPALIQVTSRRRRNEKV